MSGGRPDGLGHEKKLKDKDVLEIRKLYAETCETCGRKKWTQKTLAKTFGVSVALINYVLKYSRHFKKKIAQNAQS